MLIDELMQVVCRNWTPQAKMSVTIYSKIEIELSEVLKRFKDEQVAELTDELSHAEQMYIAMRDRCAQVERELQNRVGLV